MECDLYVHGAGPSGGYKARVNVARQTADLYQRFLIRVERAESALAARPTLPAEPPLPQSSICPHCSQARPHHDSACEYEKFFMPSAAPLPSAEACEWIVDDDGLWSTACGNEFFFDSGTPAENKQKFCGYCGRTLKAAPPVVVASPDLKEK